MQFFRKCQQGGVMMIKKIGITGPSGSGKSLLSECLNDALIPTINADKLYHSMLIPPSRCLDALAHTFGNDILKADGTIDRTVLASRVFCDDDQLKLLNDTVLPIVIDEIRALISNLEASGETTVAIDAPTLIESGFHKECDLVVSVLASRDVRISRISMRDSISVEKARERVDAQHSDDFYLSASDKVLINDKDIDSFKAQAAELITLIKTL